MDSNTNSGNSATTGLAFARLPTNTCDESKCVSRALSDLHDGSFTCYGGDDRTMYPRICADGFLPVVLQDEPTRQTTDAEDGGAADVITLSYYTCCAPDDETNGSGGGTSDDNHGKNNRLQNSHQQQPRDQEPMLLAPRRRCSDPIAGHRTINVCAHEESRKYSYSMKANVFPDAMGLVETESVMCCDYSNIEREGIKKIEADSLERAECVPYRSPFYEAFRATNDLGKLRPRTCDFPDGSFGYPSPLEGVDDATSGRYRCCRTGPGLQPFEKDAAFRNFVYPSLAVHCLAVVITVVVAIALLLPLLLQLYHRSKEAATTRTENKPHSATSRTSFSTTNATNTVDSVWTTRWSEKPKARYSTYNLYLFYLLVVDLAYLLYQIQTFSNYIHQNFKLGYWASGGWVRFSDLTDLNNNLTWDKVFNGPYLFINLWINCIIVHQILALLRGSQRARRVKLPSLTRVNVQMAIGLILAIAVGFVTHKFMELIDGSIARENYHMVEVMYSYYFLVICVFVLPPVAYVLCAVIVIWWKGYIPAKTSDSRRARGIRELTFYVCRIVAVYFGIWVPVLALTMYSTAKNKPSALVAVNLLAAVQPIITAGMILTKSDARGYVRLFWGRLFCCCCCCCCINNEDATVGVEESTNRIRSNISIDLELEIDPEVGPADPSSSDEESIGDDEEEESTVDEEEESAEFQNRAAPSNGSLENHDAHFDVVDCDSSVVGINTMPEPTDTSYEMDSETTAQ